MAYPTAIGCGCLLGAGGAAHLWAAEWSAQPSVSWTTDYDSDRALSGASQGSESAVILGDLKLQRASDSTQLVLEPKYDLRRYSDSIWGPGNDRSLNATLGWTGQKNSLNFSGSIANQTTLTTEVQETGIINGDLRQRFGQLNGQWSWLRTERHQFFLQASYTDVSYSGGQLVELTLGGPLVQELPGYKYSSGSLGERFFTSERTTVSVSAFGDALDSPLPGNSSHEEGAQVEVNSAYSERLSFDVSLGQSRRSLDGKTSNGTNTSVLITRSFARGNATLSYTRSLTPYGTGVLVQRSQASAGLTRSLTEYLDANINLVRIQNSQSTERIGLDRPYYNNVIGGLSWKMGESWTVATLLTTSWTQPIGVDRTVHEWRAALSMTWKPLPETRSR
jgi:hypothetical protein